MTDATQIAKKTETPIEIRIKNAVVAGDRKNALKRVRVWRERYEDGIIPFRARESLRMQLEDALGHTHGEAFPPILHAVIREMEL